MVSVADFESRLNTLDVSLFDAILSGTSEQDRLALLELQRAVREAFGEYVYLEIGSHLGGSIQPHLIDPRCQKIYSIDKRPAEQPDERGISFPYPNNSTQKMLKLLENISAADMHKIVAIDADASEIDPAQIDVAPQFCFIDGEHTNRAVISDFEFCYKICAPNSLIVFHDVNIVGEGVKAVLRSLQEKGIKHSAVHVGGVVFAIGLGDVELSNPEKLDPIPVAESEGTQGNWVLEPDPISLAAQMRHVFDNVEQAREKGLKGSNYVKNHLTWVQAAEKVQDRLYALQEKPIRREMNLNQHVSLGGTPEPVAEVGVAAAVFVWPNGGDTTLCNDQVQRFTPSASRTVVLEGEIWSQALNAQLSEITESYVAVLRDDVVVTEGWLSRLTDYLDAQTDVAVIVPRLPVGDRPQFVKTKYKSLKRELQRFGKRFVTQEPEELLDVESIQTACVIIRTDVLRLLGGFDGGFNTPGFWVDFVRRCLQMNQRVVCASNVFVHCEKVVVGDAEQKEKHAVDRLVAGDVLRAEGDPSGALACYKEALETKPNYLEAALIHSAVLLEEDRPEEAAHIFEALVEKHPDSSRLHNYYGRCLFMAGKRADGKVEFEKSIELDSEFGEAYSNLAVLLWEDGDLDEALDKMNRAAELSPQSPDVIFNIGMIYAQLGQGTMAIEMLQHYLTMSPNDLHAKTYLAVLLLENGAEQDGVAQLEDVLAVDPEHPEALRVLGDLQMAVDDADGGQSNG
ncbi:MAG: tetratricopeptide repeat protein [Candidatus Latescibacteria bacterium]|nr:tetratricopeptide repeat protein [Candidatus Latescibacterota bacterium]